MPPVEATTEEVTVPVDEGSEVSESQTPEDSWAALGEAFDAPEPEYEEDEPELETEPAVAEDAPVSEPEPELKSEGRAEPESAEKPAAEEEQVEEEVQEQPRAEEPPQPQQPPNPYLEAQRMAFEQQQRQASRQAALADLEQTYAIPETDVELLQTEPEKVLPRMAAELELRVMERVMQLAESQLPSMVSRVTEQKTESQKREEVFYNEWPQLREHGAQVAQIAQMWRQMNPQADTRKAVQEIGRIASAALGLQGAAPAEPAPAPAPLPPVASPVTPSSPPTGRVAQKSMNPYEAMAMAWEETDDDF